MKWLTLGEILLIFVEPAFGKARHSYYYFGKVNVDGCVCVCMRMSVQICPGHNSYIYAWISKLFGTVIVLEKKCHLNYFFR